jgi:hypothetical protein
LLSDNINQTNVTLNVPPVKLPLLTCVSLVVQTDNPLQLVNVLIVTLKTTRENVSHVDQNVKLVKMRTNVIPVLVIELNQLLDVMDVQLIILIVVNHLVANAQIDVKNVILMVTVPNVELMPTQSQIVVVLLTISNLFIKVKKFVKFVMSDVMNVLTFSITVYLVLLILEDLMPHTVNVLLDILINVE